jgi:hypothetical protein
LIDQGCALRDKSVTDPVRRLEILLRLRLEWNEPHGRSARSFVDRFGIDSVVLRATDECLDETRMDQTDLEAGSLKASAPIMSTWTGFHGDDRRCEFGHNCKQLRPASFSREDASVITDTM